MPRKKKKWGSEEEEVEMCGGELQCLITSILARLKESEELRNGFMNWYVLYMHTYAHTHDSHASTVRSLHFSVLNESILSLMCMGGSMHMCKHKCVCLCWGHYSGGSNEVQIQKQRGQEKG